MKLLLVKLSSLGDILHTFPALNDLQKVYPDLEVTWVVDTSFREAPWWHPSVKHVIEVPLRKMKRATWRERFKVLVTLIKTIRREQYDVVLDPQGLFKSALIAKLARAPSVGYAKGCGREPTWWLYNTRMPISYQEHAIKRIQKLARALFPAGADVALDGTNYPLVQWQPIAAKILFFAHGTTWTSKEYPDVFWRELVEIATAAGYTVWLAHGNDRELQRAESLKINEHVVILPKMSLTDLKNKLYEVSGVVGVDTGLSHIMAGLGVPALTLLGPTDPLKIGTIGNHQAYLNSKLSCAPCEKRVCTHPDRANPPSPPCFREMTPAVVFNRLQTLLNSVVTPIH